MGWKIYDYRLIYIDMLIEDLKDKIFVGSQMKQQNLKCGSVTNDSLQISDLSKKSKVLIHLQGMNRTIPVHTEVAAGPHEALRMHIQETYNITLPPKTQLQASDHCKTILNLVATRPCLLGGSTNFAINDDKDNHYIRDTSPNDSLPPESPSLKKAITTPTPSQAATNGVSRISEFKRKTTMMVGQKAIKTVDKLNKKQLRKKLAKQKMFTVAFPKNDDEKDEDEDEDDSNKDGEDWLNFFKHLNSDDLYNLSQAEFEPMVEKTNVAGQMQFINKMSQQDKHELINLVEYQADLDEESRLPFKQIEPLKKIKGEQMEVYQERRKMQIYEEKQKQQPTIDWIKEFIAKWKNEHKRAAINHAKRQTLLFPSAVQNITSNLETAILDILDLSNLRDLVETNEDDKKFVELIDEMPRLIYDYKQINIHLCKATLRSIEDIPLSTSHINQKLRKYITGDICNVIMDMKYFNRDLPQKEMNEKRSNNAKGIMRCFDEDSLQNMTALQHFPAFQKMLADEFTSEEFLDISYEKDYKKSTVFEVLSQKMNDPEQIMHMVKMLATFDKQTQTIFLDRFSNKMRKFDLIQDQKDNKYDDSYQFHPILLALKDTEYIKEVPIEPDAIDLKSMLQRESQGRSESLKNLKELKQQGEGPHWIANYPIMSFIGKKGCNNSKLIFMAHMNDLEQPYMRFKLRDDEEFVTFVEKFQQNKDASISMLIRAVTKQDKTTKLIFRTYSYPNPFQKRSFNDQVNWKRLEDETFQYNDQVLEQLKRKKKVSLVTREEYGEEKKGLLIQTDESIWFYNVENEDAQDFKRLIDEEYSVKLIMLRGLRDKFYFALRDDGAASDSLQVFDFFVNDKGSLEHISEPIPAPYTGEILALELDPLNTNDVESYYHDNELKDEWYDKFDRIYLIDGRLNLFQLSLERECRTLQNISLTTHKNIQTIIETEVRDTSFIRLGITDRCLTIRGRTYNLQTGHEWDFFYNPRSEEQEIIFSEKMPLSMQQIALLKCKKKAQVDSFGKKEENDSYSFLIKNDPSSRRRVLFDHRSDDVILFAMFSDDLILAKVKGNSMDEMHKGDSSEDTDDLDDIYTAKANNQFDAYWSLMDSNGKIYSIPGPLYKLLKKRDWNSVSIQRIKDPSGDSEMDQIMILLKHYKMVPRDIKKQQQMDQNTSQQALMRSSKTIKEHKNPIVQRNSHERAKIHEYYNPFNPFPDLGAVVIDLKATHVYKKTFVTADKIRQETNISQESLTSLIQDNIMMKTFKTVITSNNQIYLLYSDYNMKKSPKPDDMLTLREGDIPIRILPLMANHKEFFKQPESALVIGSTIYLKDAENRVLALQHNPEDNTILWPQEQINMSLYKLAPKGDCILSHCSKFFRCDPTEARLDPPLPITTKAEEEEMDHELAFPDKLQFSYASKLIACEVNKLKILPEDKETVQKFEELKDEIDYGRSEQFLGVNLIFDPEKYVDTGFKLKKLTEGVKKPGDHGDHLKIWSNINESPTGDHYYVSQDWNWLQTKMDNYRRFSFLGLYRKFCEADIYELMRLKDIIREKKSVRQVEILSLFSDFHGNSVFSIFYKEHKVLNRIHQQLERGEFLREYDDDDNAVENSTLRRIYYVLACHRIGQQKKLMPGSNKPSQVGGVSMVQSSEPLSEAEDAESEVKTKSFSQWIQKLCKKDSKDDDADECKQKINCNSLLYKILFSDKGQNRDLIFAIASLCDEFSLTTFIMQQDDIKKLLSKPTMQVVKTFDNILVDTQYTRQIITLDISPEERLTTFWCKKFRLSPQECQNRTTRKLRVDMGVEDDEIMMNQVTVKMMEIGWLKAGGKNFLDLVEAINDTSNTEIQATRFVSSLLSGYWDIYKTKIFWTQFLPYVFYMIGIHFFLVNALKDPGDQDTEMAMAMYCPLFGYCAMFIINQAKTELIQWRNCETNSEYFTDYWNINDLVYLILNTLVLICNFLSLIPLYNQRVFAAISVCFLWFKVFDWLRLFDTTAFFISLILDTIYDIRSFLMILFICYMMFGSAFYILNMNRVGVVDSEGQSAEFVPDISGFWVFDAFQNQYELGLGEFQLDGFRASGNQEMLIYLLFLVSTFMIQITFLNMLIAIMGDTFEKAIEQRENNARLTKLRIMGDYIYHIDKEDTEHQLNEHWLFRQFRMLSNIFKEEDKYSVSDESGRKEENILYVVQPSQDGEQHASWEGQLSALKRFTERIVTKSESQLIKKVDKVLDRVIEAEARDSTQEREQKLGMEKMMESVKKEIAGLDENNVKVATSIDLILEKITRLEGMKDSPMDRQ